VVDLVEIKGQRQLFERVELLFGYFVVFVHLFKNDVSALAGAFGLSHWVVVRRVFYHAHQSCRFLYGEFFGLLAEVDVCR
jgi:hypothetical protein